jgi:hypothetical protein
LLAGCAAAGASGLILRLPLAADPDVLVAAKRAGLTVIGLQPGFSWAHVVWLLRTVLDRTAADDSGRAGVHTDLFSLADTIAAIVDAPVTVEDSQSRVLAYSSAQDAADAARVSTIVGRRVPAAVVAHMRSRGVFRKLAGSDEPFLTPAGPGGTRPRLVVPVRAGNEWLGSIWALRSTAVDATTSARLRDAASVVALHLLRLRAEADVVGRESTERLRALLRGAPPASAADVSVPVPCRVVALHSSGEREVAVDLWRATLRRHGWADPLLADLDGTVFAVVGEGEGIGSWVWLAGVVAELRSSDPLVRAAAGGAARQAGEITASCRAAAEVLAVLDGSSTPEVAVTVEDAWVPLTIARASAGLRAQAPVGPFGDLRAHDREHGTEYATTLTAWLRHPGRPLAAARELHVHVNTLRYRMARLSALLDLDLDDPTVRLAAQLQLAAPG